MHIATTVVLIRHLFNALFATKASLLQKPLQKLPQIPLAVWLDVSPILVTQNAWEILQFLINYKCIKIDFLTNINELSKQC